MMIKKLRYYLLMFLPIAILVLSGCQPSSLKERMLAISNPPADTSKEFYQNFLSNVQVLDSANYLLELASWKNSNWDEGISLTHRNDLGFYRVNNSELWYKGATEPVPLQNSLAQCVRLVMALFDNEQVQNPELVSKAIDAADKVLNGETVYPDTKLYVSQKVDLDGLFFRIDRYMTDYPDRVKCGITKRDYTNQ